ISRIRSCTCAADTGAGGGAVVVVGLTVVVVVGLTVVVVGAAVVGGVVSGGAVETTGWAGTIAPSGRQIWSPGKIGVSTLARFWSINARGVTPAASAMRYHESPTPAS